MSRTFLTGIRLRLSLAVLLGVASGCSMFVKPRIFYINSYHEGYGSSDEVMQGIRETLMPTNARLHVFFMDTKRRREPEFIEGRIRAVLAGIREFRPTVIVAFGDEAVRYVVARYFREGPIPVVFCGMSWDCEQYGLPTRNVTGMVEVLPAAETIMALKKYYPQSKTLTVLSGSTTAQQSNREFLDPVYAQLGLEVSYAIVETYEQWKAGFARANEGADLVFVATNEAIEGWDDADARAFVKEKIRVPVFACDDFMMPYAVFGLTKVDKEQGVWAAKTALAIHRGKRPKDIPVVHNRQVKAYFNPVLAEKVGFKPDQELLAQCAVVR